MPFPQFLLESSICLLLFYLFYYLVLRKETFFQLNRAYLLVSPLLAILIPIINIQLAQPKTTTTNSFESIIYPAVTNAHYVNQFFWEQIDRPTPAFSLTIADILLLIYALGVFWMSMRLMNGVLRLFRLIANSQIHKSNGYTMVQLESDFPAASFFSYVFWNGQNIEADKKLIFEHELVHIRQHHSFDVLLMELWVIVKWYNPLIYLYRNALQVTHEYIADKYVAQQAPSVYQYASLLVQQSQNQACHQLLSPFSLLVKKRLQMLGQHQSKWYKGFKYILSIPIFASMMLLFSFNLVEEIPSNPLSNSLTSLELMLTDLGEHTLVEIEKEKPYQQYMEWGGIEFPLEQIDLEGALTCNVRILSPTAFQQIQKHSFTVQQLYDEQAIQSFESLIETSSGNTLSCDNDLQLLYQQLEKIKEEFSLFLKLTDSQQQVHYTILSVSNTNNFYYKNANQSVFFNEINSLKFSVPTTEQVIHANDLQFSGLNKYYLEWGTHKIQALKSGNPLKEPYDIPSLSMLEYEQLKTKNFSLIYNNSCLLIDSVYTMVSNENGSQYRCNDKWSDAACYRSYLQEASENSTIYLVIKTKLGDIFSSIISIGDESTLYLENEAFFSEILAYTHFPLSGKNIIQPVHSNYELLWGGIHIPLRKEGLDKPFRGQYEITREDFLEAIEQEPMLGLENGNWFDNISMDISTNDKNSFSKTLALGTINSRTDQPDAYQKSLDKINLSQYIKDADYIGLKDIRYNDMMSDRIHALIKFTDSPTPQIQSVRNRVNSYQFHWGELDIEINQQNDSKTYRATSQLSIDDFKQSINREPILTSSKNGVLFDYQFQLTWKKEHYTVKSKPNDPDIYLNSLDIEAIQNGIAVGDTILIKQLNTKEAKEAFYLAIKITEPSEANIKSTRYKDRIVLDWGDFEFGIRQLNGDKRNAVTPPALTLKAAFLKTFICNEPQLYDKGKQLEIKEATVLVKESDYQESCSTDDWQNRDGIINLLENACEESSVHLFFKTKQQKNYILQFRLSDGLVKEEISFGNDTTQVFNGILKDYAQNSYQAKSNNSGSKFNDPTYKNKLADKNIQINWGDLQFDLGKTRGRFGSRKEINMNSQHFAMELNKNLSAKIDGAAFPVDEVHIFGNYSSDNKKARHRTSMNCIDGICHLLLPDIDSVLALTQTEVINMFFIHRDKDADEYINIGSLEINFANTKSNWTPPVETQKLKTNESTYPFQMINRSNRHTIVRMDTTNQKYEWMAESYRKNPTVEVIHIDDFKTYQRVVEATDALVEKENIKKVEVLSKAASNPLTYPDYHAFGKKSIALYWRDFKASSFDADFYCLEDFKKATGDLIFSIDGVAYPIVQFDAHFIAEDSTTAQFISDTVDKKEINKALRKAKERTTIVFDQILFQNETGEVMRFPIRFLFYLE